MAIRGRHAMDYLLRQTGWVPAPEVSTPPYPPHSLCVFGCISQSNPFKINKSIAEFGNQRVT